MDPLENRNLSGGDGNEPLTDDVPEDDPKERCPICQKDLENAIATMCGHVFCEKCLDAFMRYTCTCPICKENIYGDSP